MVYPNQVITNENWTTNTGIDILLALGENDGLYIYNTAPINLLHLGMPQEVVNCEVRIRGTTNPPAGGIGGSSPPPAETLSSLILNFYLSGNLIYTAVLEATSEWVIHTLTVNRWDSVALMADLGSTVGVDFLRAEPYGGSPTKRTLTGVGV